jgi:glucose-1-phosphate thymidylyltransferase
VKAGESYVDVGTIDGYRTAIALLAESSERDARRFKLRAVSMSDTLTGLNPAFDGGLS